VTRAHGSQDSFWKPSLSAEGRLRRAAGAQREILFRDRRKRGEPQDRQRPAIRSRGRGGINRRGGAKPRGRHADGDWRSHLEGGARRRHRPQNRCVERNVSGSRIPRSVRWRGDLWTTPREETRLCGRVARTGTRRIVGAKVRRVARTTTKVVVSGPVEGPRGPGHGNVAQGRGGQQ
jgi:hypothetical protein